MISFPSFRRSDTLQQPSAGRGIVALLTGSIGAQIVTLAALPILSRLFTPLEFGYFSLVMAYSGIIAPAAALRLETAVMLPERVEQVRALTRAGLVSIFTISVLVTAALEGLLLIGASGVGESPLFPVWVGAYILTTSLFMFLGQLALRKREYSLVARRSLLQAVVASVMQVLLGLWRKIPDGLLLGGLLGRSAGIAVLLKHTREFLRKPPRGGARQALREYWRFPVIFTPSIILNSLGLLAPLIYLTAVFGVTAAGQIGMAEKIVAVPVTVIGAAVGQAVDAEVSRAIRDRVTDHSRFYLRLTIFLGSIGALVAVVGGTLGGIVIPLILGEKWQLAGQIVQILSITSAVRLVATPLAKFIVLLQKSFANSTLDITRVVLVAAAMFTCTTLKLDLISSVWIIYSALTVTYVATWLYGLALVYRRRPTSQIGSV